MKHLAFRCPSSLLLSLTLFSAFGGVAYGANILFLSPHTSHSHTHFFFYIIKELAARGHTITHWNGLPPREEMINVTQLHSPELQHFNSHHPIGFAANKRAELLLRMPEQMVDVCNACYRDAVFHRLLNTKEHFDLIVIESFMNECMLRCTSSGTFQSAFHLFEWPSSFGKYIFFKSSIEN